MEVGDNLGSAFGRALSLMAIVGFIRLLVSAGGLAKAWAFIGGWAEVMAIGLILTTLAFGVFVLSYIEGIGAAKTFAAKYREYIDPNQELLANGATNLAAGLFRGYTVGGSMSRPAVNDAAGAQTPAAGAIAAVILGIVLLFFTGPFSHLPEMTLAAIVFVAVRRLIDVPAIPQLWRISKGEFLAAAGAFGVVLVFGMLEGIVIRLVAMSLLFAPMPVGFIANAATIKEHLDHVLATRSVPPGLVVIDMGSAPLLDFGAIAVLSDLRQELSVDGTDLRFANLYAQSQKMMLAADPAFAPLLPNRSIGEAIADWDSGPATTTSTAEKQR